ncbi:MAG: HlyD family efflux transporter periplasmic adaptor subunit [Paralcaligenes sp.]
MTTENKSASKRKPLLLAAALIFILLGIAYAIWWVLVLSHYESTDDAYVHGNLVQVTSQISGTVIAIEADDTQNVKIGTPLVKLDATDADVALKQAEASLAQAVRHTHTLFVQNIALKADVALGQANVERADVDLNKAQSDLKRRQTLAKTGGISGEEILHAQTAVKAAQAGIAQAQAALAASRAKLLTNQALTAGTTVAAHPDVKLAADHVRNAWLALARTSLPAPINGMVAQRSVQVGQHVAPGTPLMTLIPLQQVWVEGNFKENQVAHMLPGQKVELTSDLYGGDVVYHGKIEGIAAGTGSAFALLPAQNASGNWIKVVQRIPVRISLDPKQLAEHPLRVGLSMVASVHLIKPDAKDAAQGPNSKLETNVFEGSKDGVDAVIAKIIKENLES